MLNQVWNRFQRVCSWPGKCFMITKEVNVFQKMQKCKTCIGKVWGVGPPWYECRGVAGCHSASKSAKRHSISAKWHSSCAKWDASPLSNIHAIPCNFVFSDNFFKISWHSKIFLVKLRHSDMSNSLVFKKSSLASLFSKIDQIKFFLRLMNSCSKLGAFAHVSFIFNQKKNK